jgi:hypothetical protein
MIATKGNFKLIFEIKAKGRKGKILLVEIRKRIRNFGVLMLIEIIPF